MRSESPQYQWRKSSRSGGTNCVEAAMASDRVIVRDSKCSAGPTISFLAADWTAFVQALQRDQLA
ncbi:DUF397 domain-containing protein [Dactylosporangium sp. NPDC051541]|uniref:DUF397 domain-containing protein n=1 Tax=Dactylosporangium sp. NPDC051541 TaxID=3363977 RepID=UPI00379784B2